MSKKKGKKQKKNTGKRLLSLVERKTVEYVGMIRKIGDQVDKVHPVSDLSENGHVARMQVLEATRRDHLLNRSTQVALQEDQLQEFAYLATFSSCWKKYGRPHFRLTPELTAALILSESHVPMSRVNPPFETTLISFLGKSPFTVSTLEEEREKLEYLKERVIAPYLMVYRFGHDESLESKIGLTHPGSTYGDLQHSSMKKMWRITALAGAMTAHTTKLVDDEEASCESWASRAEERDEGVAFHLDDKDAKVLIAATRLVTNLCLYLQERKVRGVGDGVLDLKKSSSFPTVVGREVKLPSQLIEAASDYAHRGVRTGWKAQKRFVVRGHFKMQACGKGNKDRKEVWIQPYWKGPTTAEAIERLYKVETFNEAGLTDA